MSFFKGQKVVVTGGAGFLGSHLVDQLITIGADVVVVDDLRHNVYLNKHAQYLRLDAGNERALVPAFKGAFAVFNLAAHVAGVIYNQANHLEMYHQNERVQIAPVLAAQSAGVERFLQVSSVCVYAPGYNAPAIETNGWEGEPVAANNGYSWAKRMGERAALWSTIPHPVIVRPSNLYGPRDDFGERCHVIPAIIKKTLHDPIVRLNGTGQERREFLYVEDAAQGLIAAMANGDPGHTYNLAGRFRVDMRTLAHCVQAAAGIEKSIEFAAIYDAGDNARWSDDDTFPVRRIQTPSEIGLANTIAWYKEHR